MVNKMLWGGPMTKRQKKWIFIGLGVYVVINLVLYIFMPETILQNGNITPEVFLSSRPSIVLFNTWTIIVPSSTIIVYILGIQILYLGYTLMKDKQYHWGASLLFWGIGTILAGTSYQGLGYELKCSGNEYCQFTSWFELSYLFTTAISISLMGFAFAKSFTTGKCLMYLKGYSEVALILYTILLIIGSVISSQLLISYELFTVFFMPLFVVFFVINILNNKKHKNDLEKAFIRLWILFLIVNVAYYVYYIPGITEMLYENTGIWFSANDVLHLGLIGWFAYFQLVIRKKLVIHAS